MHSVLAVSPKCLSFLQDSLPWLVVTPDQSRPPPPHSNWKFPGSSKSASFLNDFGNSLGFLINQSRVSVDGSDLRKVWA